MNQDDSAYTDNDDSPVVESKLTNWPNEPTLQNLKADLDAAKPYHDQQVENIRRWNEMMNVRGAYKPRKQKGRSSVQPKLIRRQAEWRYSALTEPFLGTEKLFSVQAATASDVKSAEQNELVINWQMRTQLNRVKFIDDYVRSAVDDGSVFVKIGWSRVVIPTTQEIPVFSHYVNNDPNFLKVFQDALSRSISDPEGFEREASPEIQASVKFYDEQGSVTQAIQTGTTTVEDQFIVENRPILEVIDPENVYIDPSCNGDISKALFCVFAFETNKAALQKENRYSNLDKVNWDSNGIDTNSDYATKTPNDFSFKDAARKKVVAYEYWGQYDIDGNGVLTPIVCTWIGDTIIRMEANPFPDQKIPLVMANYMPVKRDLYGESDANLLEDNQKILGSVTRGMIDLLGKSANSQMGTAKGMLDPLNRRRFEEGRDYEFNPNLPPSVGLIQHKFPELPQSALQMVNMQNQEAEALTGVKAFSGGISGNAYGDVATGIKSALDASAKREMAILRRLAMGITEIGTKIISMNGAFLSEEEVVPITDDQFVTVTREELQGKHNIIVDISTSEIDNEKAQNLAFMLQTIGPAVQDFQITAMILEKICDLKRLPDLALALKTYQPPPPDPIAQQIQLAELELKKAQTVLANSQAQLALAQAGKNSSEKDLKDLQYVEQDTGTDHARKMQLAQAQGKANQQLEVTKALTKPLKEGEKAPNVAAAIGYNQLSDATPSHGQPE